MHQLTQSLESLLRERRIEASAFRWLEPESIPEPYRRLLAHDSDMTSTLANFHDSEIGLEVLAEESDYTEYCREVILLSTLNDKPVEYGAIQIWLDAFPAREQAAIVEGRQPLGGILNQTDRPYASSAHSYFTISAPEICQKRFECPEGAALYGCYNTLSSEDGREFASIIEILPLERDWIDNERER